MLWIIYSSYYDQVEDNSAKRMLQEALNHNIDAHLKFYQYFNLENGLTYKDEVVKELPNIVFMRCHDYDLCSYFESLNIKVINSLYTMKTCRDKWLTHQVVDKLNIKQPKTILLNNNTFNTLIEEFTLPFVLKYRHGAQGNNIYVINTEEEFNSIINDIVKEDYIVQEYINFSYGKDVRAYIIGNEIVGACKRENENSFMSNLAQGGKSYHYELTQEEKENALKIAKALKGDIVSVDFLFTEDGLSFCEANTNAGFASFNFLGYPMRKLMMEYIKKVS